MAKPREKPPKFEVHLYFDSALENQILKVWNVLKQRQLSSALIEQGSRPHLCVSVHDDLEPAKLRTAIENFAQQQRPAAVALAALGGFSAAEGTLFLVPTPTAALLTIHSHFQELLKRLGVPVAPPFGVGSWFPHCEVARRVPRERLPPALALLLGFRLPLGGHVCDIGLVENRPEMREIYVFPLGGDFM